MDLLGAVRITGILGTGLGVLAALRFTLAPALRLGLPHARAEPVAAQASVPLPRADADSLARTVAVRNPFRASRTPAQIAFDPDVPPGSASLAPATPPPPPRPTLTLVGLVLGADPAALVDGLPGSESSRALRVREGVAGYVVREIGSSHVVIAGPDTTWTLRLRRHGQ